MADRLEHWQGKARKILLIGPGGAGKSTLAATIAARTGLPLIHLDALYWHPGWVPTPRDEWRERIEALVQQPAWVMDGNYGGTMDLRVAACDTVLFLDLPTWLCAWRVLRRRLRFRGRSRPEMAEGCPEQLNLEFISWILSYRRRRRPAILSRLRDAQAAGKRIIVLTSPAAIDAFVAGLA